jgi:hypothetical protein
MINSDQIHVAMTKTCGLVVTLACQSNTFYSNQKKMWQRNQCTPCVLLSSCYILLHYMVWRTIPSGQTCILPIMLKLPFPFTDAKDFSLDIYTQWKQYCSALFLHITKRPQKIPKKHLIVQMLQSINIQHESYIRIKPLFLSREWRPEVSFSLPFLHVLSSMTHPFIS